MQTLTKKTFAPFTWDRAGVVGSFVCVSHCIATPFLAATLPILAVTEKATHIGLTVVLMLIGLLAFLPGYRLHSKPQLALVAAIGFAMLVLAVLIPEALASEALETGLTVVGGLLLITAHLSNTYYCRRCRICFERPFGQSGVAMMRASAPSALADRSAATHSPVRVAIGETGRRRAQSPGDIGHEVEKRCGSESDILSPDLCRPEPQGRGTKGLFCLR